MNKNIVIGSISLASILIATVIGGLAIPVSYTDNFEDKHVKVDCIGAAVSVAVALTTVEVDGQTINLLSDLEDQLETELTDDVEDVEHEIEDQCGGDIEDILESIDES